MVPAKTFLLSRGNAGKATREDTVGKLEIT